jgi:hypothetical protein
MGENETGQRERGGQSDTFLQFLVLLLIAMERHDDDGISSDWIASKSTMASGWQSAATYGDWLLCNKCSRDRMDLWFILLYRRRSGYRTSTPCSMEKNMRRLVAK